MRLIFIKNQFLMLIMAITLPSTVLVGVDKKPFTISPGSVSRMPTAAANPASENLPVEVTACDSAASHPHDEGRVMLGSYGINAPTKLSKRAGLHWPHIQNHLVLNTSLAMGKASGSTPRPPSRVITCWNGGYYDQLSGSDGYHPEQAAQGLELDSHGRKRNAAGTSKQEIAI